MDLISYWIRVFMTSINDYWFQNVFCFIIYYYLFFFSSFFSSLSANVLNPAEGPPKLPNVQILPPAENTSPPEPLPVVIPTMLPQPKEDLVVHPGVAVRQLSCDTLDSVEQRLGLGSEVQLCEYIDDGLKQGIEQCRDRLQVGSVSYSTYTSVGCMIRR